MSGITKYSLEQVREIINKKGYTLISEFFISVLKKIIIKDKEGYYYITTLDSFIRAGKNPARYHKSSPYTIQNIKLWCKLENKPFELLSDKYEGNAKYLKWQCLKEECKEIFEMNWGNIYTGYGCGYCVGRQVGLSNCLATKNPELAKEWHPTKNGSLTPYDVTCGNTTLEIWWVCKTCKHTWKSSANNRCKGSGCPDCSESKGERKIKEILKLYDLYYNSQYAFNDLRGVAGGLLRFDVPVFWDKEKTQLRLLIEFDGEQHFKWIRGMMTKEGFKILQYHDELKNKYCLENNIKLLRIKYNQYDSIEDIILRELKK